MAEEKYFDKANVLLGESDISLTCCCDLHQSHNSLVTIIYCQRQYIIIFPFTNQTEVDRGR